VITFDFTEATLASERVARRLRSIADFMKYAKPLMQSIERRIDEGNRTGVLAGLDKDGHPAPALSYRPKNARPATVNERLGQRRNVKRGKYAGKGSYSQFGLRPNNNLVSYKQLDGPRLAPRYQISRSISNFKTGHMQLDETMWLAVGAWVEVVSPTGYHFLPVHFKGLPLGKNGPCKLYDLRGVRPDDRELIRGDMRAWAKLTVRERWANPYHEYLGDL